MIEFLALRVVQGKLDIESIQEKYRSVVLDKVAEIKR